MTRKIFVIVNPSSGKPKPVLRMLSDEFKKKNIQWDAGVLFQDNLETLLKRAKEFGADTLGISGGDGTIAGVLSHYKDIKIPIAIIPSGTANVLAGELKLPQLVEGAIAVIGDEKAAPRPVDIGTVNDRCFITRVGWGFEADMVQGASDDLKGKLGKVAYLISAFKSFFGNKEIHFKLNIDGEEIRKKGFNLFVVNTGNTGSSDNPFFPAEIDDGLFDVYLFENGNLQSLLTAGTGLANLQESDGISHWQGKNIKVSCRPKTPVQYDGEILGKHSVEIRVVPKAVQILSVNS